MCHFLSRRQFLIRVGATAAAAATTPPILAERGPDYRQLQWTYFTAEVDFRTNRRFGRTLSFDKGDEQLVTAAMNVVARRFLNRDIAQVAVNNTKATWVAGMKSRWYVPKWNNNSVFRYFLFCNDAFRQVGFPHINLYPWRPMQDIDTEYAGWAPTAEKVIVSRKNREIDVFERTRGPGIPASFDKFTHSGQFDITLSIPKVRSLSAEQLAGTIAHEMLHNLGHAHTRGYTDDNFMTVFGDVLQTNGTFVSRSGGPGFGLVGDGIELPLPG